MKERYEKYKKKKQMKYNTLKNLYDAKCDDYDKKVIEIKVQEKINATQKKIFDEKLEELTNEIIKLKETNKKLRVKNKEKKNEKE